MFGYKCTGCGNETQELMYREVSVMAKQILPNGRVYDAGKTGLQIDNHFESVFCRKCSAACIKK